MNRYIVRVTLNETYYDIEAESEEDAFIQASDAAMAGGAWTKDIELVEENIDEL